MVTDDNLQHAATYPGLRQPYVPLWINPADPEIAVKYALNPHRISFSDIGIGMLIRSVDDPLLQAARRTWMAAAPGLAVLLLVDCPCPSSLSTNWNVQQEPPAWLSRQNTTVEVTVACYYGRRYRRSENANKTQTLWNELLKLPRRKYYMKMDTDTMLEPSLLLRFINVLHGEARSKLPHPSMLYFGRSDAQLPYDFQEMLANKRYRRFTEVITRELDELSEPPPISSSLPRSSKWLQYVQGGLIGVSHKMLQMIVYTQCVRRVGYFSPFARYDSRHANWIEDSALGICMHIFGAPIVETKCVHRNTACKCDIENSTWHQRSCSEDLWNPMHCRVGAVTMHRLKEVERYDRCWNWQQRALIPQRKTLLRPFTHLPDV